MDFFFFFSSRRRHTRSLCDWSSDVCSSDLLRRLFAGLPVLKKTVAGPGECDQDQEREEGEQQRRRPPAPLLVTAYPLRRRWGVEARGRRDGVGHHLRCGAGGVEAGGDALEVFYELRVARVAVFWVLGEQPERYGVYAVGHRRVEFLRLTQVAVDMLHRDPQGGLSVEGKFACEHLVEDYP